MKYITEYQFKDNNLKLFKKMKFFLIYSNNILVKEKLITQGYRLDILINDKHDHIRKVIARKNYGLSKLINDRDWRVRKEVARKGYGLDILVNDENEFVREIVHLYYKNMSLIEKFSRFMIKLIYKIYNYMNKML